MSYKGENPMFCLISNSLKILTFTGLMVLFTWVLEGNIHSAFAETTTNPDIMMTFATSETFDEATEIFNNFLNFITAAYVSTDGNLEVVVLDENTICISAHNGSCLSKSTPQKHDLALKAESKGPQMIVLSAYDQ